MLFYSPTYTDLDENCGIVHVNPEAFLEPCQASDIGRFCKNSWQLKTVNDFRKKINLECLTGF